MLLNTVVVVLVASMCILGAAMAVINEIRADPPFTIMEKWEKIDAEASQRIEKMIKDMK